MRDTIISEHERGGIVTIDISPEATAVTEISKEVLQLYVLIIRSFANLYEPSQVVITPCELPRSTSPADVMQVQQKYSEHAIPIDTDNPSDTVSQIESILERERQTADEYVYLPGFAYQNPTVNVYLPVGYIEVPPGDTERYRAFKYGKDRNLTPSHPPLSVYADVRDRSYVQDSDYGLDHVYQIQINVSVEPFFDDGPIGDINRARLYEAIEEIHAAVDVFDVRLSEYFPRRPQIQAELLEYDGPSSDDLIREYRLDWVERELRGTETQYEEDGKTVLGVTTEQTDILTDELRKRIEAYVDDSRDGDNTPTVDRLRVVRPDHDVLEAALSATGLEWVDDDA